MSDELKTLFPNARPSKIRNPEEPIPDLSSEQRDKLQKENEEYLRDLRENHKPLDPDAFPNEETRKLRDDLASPDPITPSFDEPDENKINSEIDAQLRFVDELMQACTSRREEQGDNDVS